MRALLTVTLASTLTAGVWAQDPSGALPTFSGRVDFVVLHVNVQDKRGGFITGLPLEAFTVIDDGTREKISLFLAEDSPVTVGLLIDNSISMHENRESLIAAATEFAAVRDRKDELFALAFNEQVVSVLPETAPFTQDVTTFRAALTEAINARGKTALFDALERGVHYATQGTHPRRVLVVISDGGDNASTSSFDAALRRAQASNVAIYTVALVDPLDFNARPERLAALARETGGAAFRPRTRSEVAAALRQVAADIRRTYTVGYTPSREPDGRYHPLKVTVAPPDGRSAVVRARAGYVAQAPTRP